MVPSKQADMMPSRQLKSPVITWAAVCLVLLKASEKKLAPAHISESKMLPSYKRLPACNHLGAGKHRLDFVPSLMTLLRQEGREDYQPLAGRRLCRAVGCTCEMSMVCSAMPLSTAHEVITPSREPDTSPGLGPLARLVTPPPADFACTKHH